MATYTLRAKEAFAFIGLWALSDRLRELPLFWADQTWITWEWFLTTNGPDWLWIFADGYHFFKAFAVVLLCVLLTKKFLPALYLLFTWFILQVLGQFLLTLGQ